MKRKYIKEYIMKPIAAGEYDMQSSENVISGLVKAETSKVDGEDVLIVRYYPVGWLKIGSMNPAYTFFLSGDDYVTYGWKHGNQVWDSSTRKYIVKVGQFGWIKARMKNMTVYDLQTSSFYYYGRMFLNKEISFASERDREVYRCFLDCQEEELKNLSAFASAQERIAENRKKEKEEKKKREILEYFGNISSQPTRLGRFARESVLPAVIYYERRGKKQTGCCSRCRNIFPLGGKARAREETVCPSCGSNAVYDTYGSRRIYRGTFQVLRRIDEHRICVRVFKTELLCTSFHRISDGTERFSLWENARIVIDNSEDVPQTREFYLDDRDGGAPVWKEGKRPTGPYNFYSYYSIVCGPLYPGNIETELAGTDWRYCGIRQCYEADPSMDSAEDYLERYLDYPQLPLLVESGFMLAAEQLVYQNALKEYNAYNGSFSHKNLDFLDQNAKALDKFFGIPKDSLYLLEDHGLLKARLMNLMYRKDSFINESVLAFLEKEGSILKISCDLSVIFSKMSTAKFCRYFKKQIAIEASKQYRKQYERDNLARLVNTYNDYLRMAEQGGFNISDSFILFPPDLKKAHDKMADMAKIEDLKQYSPMIRERQKKLQEEYEYRKDGYRIIVPGTVEEIFDEHMQNHNCVGSYAEAMAKGEVTILFLRREAAPKKSVVTVEVKKGEIMQARAFDNSDLPDQLYQVVMSFAEAKKLTVNESVKAIAA